MMEGWNDGIMENKRSDSCMYLPFFHYWLRRTRKLGSIDSNKKIDWYI